MKAINKMKYLPTTNTVLAKVTACIPDLEEGRGATLAQVPSTMISTDENCSQHPEPPATIKAFMEMFETSWNIKTNDLQCFRHPSQTWSRHVVFLLFS